MQAEDGLGVIVEPAPRVVMTSKAVLIGQAPLLAARAPVICDISGLVVGMNNAVPDYAFDLLGGHSHKLDKVLVDKLVFALVIILP